MHNPSKIFKLFSVQQKLVIKILLEISFPVQLKFNIPEIG